jgi:AraC-like DNA-binding protein
MNPLDDIIAQLRPHAVFSKPILGSGTWGVRYAATPSPSFCVVLEGQCWLAMEGKAPMRLEKGDFLLLTTTPAFTLSSKPGVRCVAGVPSRTGVRHGEQKGKPDFRMLGGTFETELANGKLLLALLPGRIHLRSTESDTSRLPRIVSLIMEEYSGNMPGREMVLARLLEVLLVDSLRSHEYAPGAMATGLMAGLRDPSISRSLGAMHARVQQGWTVANLAEHVGMSRSAFAARFSEKVGCAPMEYLSLWRMSLAQDALRRGDVGLEELAEDIGYQSASAFSTAFRKKVGCAPSVFARGESQETRRAS